MGRKMASASAAPSAPALLGMEWAEVDMHLMGLALLILILILIAAKLHGVHALLVPGARRTTIADVPGMLVRKVALVCYGAVFLVFSREKVTKSQLGAAAKAHSAASASTVEREVRLIFIRHGESVWNYVFNRGFGPSFLVRLVRVCLHELYLLPWDDSAFIDSPLSQLGLDQCSQLKRFLAKPCIEPRGAADHAVLVSGEGADSLVVSSQLRRAAATVAIALGQRLKRSHEKVVLHSSCQEISRNFDTLGLAPASAAPRLWLPESEINLDDSTFDCHANKGNKGLGFGGGARLADFARWAANRPEKTIVVGGHSLWFKSFFQLFLPPGEDHISKKKKIVNCGVIGLTMQVRRDSAGTVFYQVDPKSITTVYGGFQTK